MAQAVAAQSVTAESSLEEFLAKVSPRKLVGTPLRQLPRNCSWGIDKDAEQWTQRCLWLLLIAASPLRSVSALISDLENQ